MTTITVGGIAYTLTIERTRTGWAAAVHRARQHLGDVLFTDTLAIRQLPPRIAHLADEVRRQVVAERQRQGARPVVGAGR